MPSQSRSSSLRVLYSLGLPQNTTVCFLPLTSPLLPDTFFRGIDSLREFYTRQQDLIRSVCISYAEKGVLFSSLDGVILCPDAKIGAGTRIGPGVQIRSGVVIGENCVIDAGSILEDTAVGNDCRINASQIYSSVLKDRVSVGPYSHVRPGCVLESGCHIGDFVEIKNSSLGANTKASHLTYIGDAAVGENVNFGCGTVVSNYDGKHKHRTEIGDSAFIGCNTNLVAPVKVERGAYTAAGSTITETVPEDSLAISRVKQVNLIGWAAKKRNRP